MMKKETRFTLKKALMLRTLLRQQGGYGRLTAGTMTIAVIVLIVLGYQIVVFRDGAFPDVERRSAAAISAVQLFPQTLPVLAETGYVIEVQNSNGDIHRLPEFYHRSSGVLTDARGQVVEEGVFSLPATIDDISSASLFLFDNRSLQQPVVIRFLHGEADNDRIFLTFQTDLTQGEGRYTLATPTDDNSLINERSGLWFGDVVQNRPQLNLPELPSGWVYEGWAVVDERPLTTGRFRLANQRDSFEGFSDTKTAAPNFPGEDFLLNPPIAVFPDLQFPVDLAGQELMLTVEPDVGGVDPTGQAPFSAAFVRQSIPRLAQAGVLRELEITGDLLPKATIVLR